MDRIINTESQLEQFAAISDPNSIAPQTVANLLSYLLERVDDAIDEIYGDGSTIQVFAYNGGEISELLNNLDERILQLKYYAENEIGTSNVQTFMTGTLDDILTNLNTRLTQGYKLPHIRVTSMTDEILTTLNDGVYSVIEGTTPFIFVVSTNKTYQYYFRVNPTNIIYHSRRLNSGEYTEWKRLVFKSQEVTEPISTTIEDGQYTFEIPKEYLNSDTLIHIKALNEDTGQTYFVGYFSCSYNYETDIYSYNIFAPTGIYSATAAQNANPTNWTFKPFASQADIDSLQGRASMLTDTVNQASTAINRHNTEIADLTTGLEQTASSLTALQQQMHRTEQTISSLTQRIAELEQNAQTLSNQLTNRINNLARQIPTLTRFIDMQIEYDQENSVIFTSLDPNFDIDNLESGVWLARCTDPDNIVYSGLWIQTDLGNGIKTQVGFGMAGTLAYTCRRIAFNDTWLPFLVGTQTINLKQQPSYSYTIGHVVGSNITDKNQIDQSIVQQLMDNGFINESFMTGFQEGASHNPYYNDTTEETNRYDEGYEAGYNDVFQGETTNPYDIDQYHYDYQTWEDGYSHGWAENPNNPDNQDNTEQLQVIYEEGYQAGSNDTYQGETPNPYEEGVAEDEWTNWQNGYAAGWSENSSNPDSPNYIPEDEPQENMYEEGYQAGITDEYENQTPNPYSQTDQMEAFNQGYEAGWSNNPNNSNYQP